MAGGSLSGMTFAMRRGRLLQTGQITTYHAGDDGGCEAGLAKAYTVYTTGQYSGTSNLDVPSYVAATISFIAPNTVASVPAGLAHILTGDTVVIKGSASNDGVYTVAAGGVAASFTTVEAVVDEAASAYVSLYKRAAHSNNAVWDRRTGLLWSRYTSDGEKVGEASDGLLNWYNAARCYTLHPVAADLAMVAGNILRVTGSDESTRYHAGDILVCSGFANAVNNYPGYRVVSCSFTGGNTDIVLDSLGETLIAEAAGGARDINLVCRSIFGYCEAANAVSLAGFSDWRVPNAPELLSLVDEEAPTAIPDVAAFPGWPAAFVWSSTTESDFTTAALRVSFFDGEVRGIGAKTLTRYAALVRG